MIDGSSWSLEYETFSTSHTGSYSIVWSTNARNWRWPWRASNHKTCRHSEKIMKDWQWPIRFGHIFPYFPLNRASTASFVNSEYPNGFYSHLTSFVETKSSIFCADEIVVLIKVVSATIAPTRIIVLEIRKAVELLWKRVRISIIEFLSCLEVIHNSSNIGAVLPLGLFWGCSDPITLIVIEIVLQPNNVANLMCHCVG